MSLGDDKGRLLAYLSTCAEVQVSDELAMTAATRLAELVERYAPGLLAGLHVVGSAVYGDFQPGQSDLDFVAVLAQPPNGAELEALEIVHRVYAVDGTLPILDGIWLTEHDLTAGPDEVPDGRLRRIIALLP